MFSTKSVYLNISQQNAEYGIEHLALKKKRNAHAVFSVIAWIQSNWTEYISAQHAGQTVSVSLWSIDFCCLTGQPIIQFVDKVKLPLFLKSAVHQDLNQENNTLKTTLFYPELKLIRWNVNHYAMYPF